ncbi:Do family serine endopeptidase [Vibrio rumoiensis]|uniref:peptidase Do n=1 Tax=Vibrio rumoiensis 1S-45 TaxID=1188252 RepID=A0A1E5E249_9VIBR|nr:Do family serine endopeptidase [Vibrio rumoiensis]OEF25490.1 serine endoprotease DegQ [Vibrio rumoiensis 1S-45]
MKGPLLVLSAVSLSLSAILTPVSASATIPNSVNGQEMPSLAPMLAKVTPAVVTVSVEGKKTSNAQSIPEQFRYFFGPDIPVQSLPERQFKGLGSGVIIDAKNGYIVTNYHVINDADKIQVTLSDKREFNATLIGGDKLSDIALIKLDKKISGLTQATLADSDHLRVGDFAVAIGNPFGLGQTVTSGIISALGRSGLNIENFENFIQTDAAINTGNSGGALVNLNGELVGINTAILGPNGGNVGIGFAIPSNMVKNLTEQIIEFGEVKRGILGVQGGEITPDLAEAMGYSSSKGAFVSQVMPDSAAEKAGLKAGDVITSINGKEIATFGELRAKIATIGAGKEVELGLLRDGKAITADVTLGEMQQLQASAEELHPGLEGAQFSNTNSSDAISGIKITDVAKGSPAESYQLKQDDIIIGVNRTRVKNLAQMKKVLEHKTNILALNIQRGDRTIYLVVK